MSDARYQVALGDSLKGERRECKTLAGARRCAAHFVAQGWPVTIWLRVPTKKSADGLEDEES